MPPPSLGFSYYEKTLGEELEEDAINWLLDRPRKPWKPEESLVDGEDIESESYAIITSVKSKKD